VSILFILFFLISFSSLFAQEIGFGKNRFHIEYTRSHVLSHSGSYVDFLDKNNKGTFPNVNTAFDAGLYVFSQSPRNAPFLKSKPDNLRFEYGLRRNLGIGLSLHKEIYSVDNYSTTNMSSLVVTNIELLLRGQPGLTPGDANRLYLGYKDNIPISAVGTINVELAWHFLPGRRLDPYIRGSFGRGYEYINRSNVTKFSGSVGSRYFISENFYLLAELEIARNSIASKNRSIIDISKRTPAGNIDEIYISAGLGISFGPFWEKWKFSDSEEIQNKAEEDIPVKSNKEEIDNYKKIIDEIRLIEKEENIRLTSRGGKMTIIFLDDALFPSGSDKIIEKGEKSVRRVTKILKKIENVNFTVEGHTDNVPIGQSKDKFSSNDELSLARAKKVKEIMEEEEISRERLFAKGVGDRKPIKPNSSPDGRKVNRRIEIVANKDLSEIEELRGLLKSEQ